MSSIDRYGEPAALADHEAQAVLAWLAMAGLDVGVTDMPCNWLAPAASPAPAAPPAAANGAPSVPVGVTRSAGRTEAAPVRFVAAEALAAATDSLGALNAAASQLEHPLRRPGQPARLVEGHGVSGIIVLCDQPCDDDRVTRLRERMLAAIGLDQTRCLMLNRLPWSTPGASPPRAEQMAPFAPFVDRALALAPARLVLAFGQAASAIAGPDVTTARARGRWHDWRGGVLLPTLAPQRLLDQPELKGLAWADLQTFAARMEQT